jgi:hypothetical protein
MLPSDQERDLSLQNLSTVFDQAGPGLPINADTIALAFQSQPVELSQTFFLNSNPTAEKIIYLDFNGHTTTGTRWNQDGRPATIVTPRFTIDSDADTFSDYELARIQAIWQRVAEDFAPFNVNVTTQDPGAYTQWGTRVAIGGSALDWYSQGPDGDAIGVALLNSFGDPVDTPVFVFSNDITAVNGERGGENGTANTITHETGHALHLRHHGISGPLAAEYYDGHGGSGATSWAPIMGSGDDRSLQQWSRGDYPNASNPTQDDLSVITTENGFGYRTDDYSDATDSARSLNFANTKLVDTFGVITTTGDVDYFTFSLEATTSLNLRIDPALRGASLDIQATIFNANRNILALSNPLDSLYASFTNVVLDAGEYYLSVEGVGLQASSTFNGYIRYSGYSDYGSLGQYRISGTRSGKNPDYNTC